MSRFGGHETFPIREGWLPKALRVLKEDSTLFADKHACDRLGVGRNMAKSIRHWLVLCGLVGKAGINEPMKISEMGRLVLKKDANFVRPGTWWAMHINIATQANDAVVWNWFFNHRYPDRFDRIRLADDIRRQLTLNGQRLPTANTLNRDIQCMLASYAIPVPPDDEDPEDGLDCPFRMLNLVTHLRESETYQVNRKNRALPSAIVGYAFAKSANDAVSAKYSTISLAEAFSSVNSPAKALMLEQEVFHNVLQQLEEELGKRVFHVELSGSERTVRYLNQAPRDWLDMYYKDVV